MKIPAKLSSSKFMSYIKAPIRVLSKARDLYVDSMNSCAGRVNYGTSTLPKSFSVSSSVSSSRMSEDEDIRVLMRALSQKKQASETPVRRVGSKGLPKSFSVGIGRIDEDEPYDFNDDIKFRSDLMYPRSKSYAVTNGRRVPMHS